MEHIKFKELSGFTLIELLVVISVIGFLASIILMSLNIAREKARIAQAVANQRQIMKATAIYYEDMGFYPPDVYQGYDPGFVQPLPLNPDTGATDWLECYECPPNWQTLILTKWRGPYIAKWPSKTPWGGEYDYNMWLSTPFSSLNYSANCDLPGGHIWIAIRPDDIGNNQIPAISEQKMINMGTDNDGCINGESQMWMQ